MRKYFFLLSLALLGLTFGCASDDDGGAAPAETDLTLNFRAFYGTDPLVMYANTYDYPDGMAVRFQTFQFYISNITLIGDTSELLIKPVDLVLFNEVQSEDAAAEGVDVLIEDVPTGLYRGIRFGLGVDTIVNINTQAQDYPSDHPLSKNYWSWARGYIFTSIEGQADLNGDGVFTGVGYHTGDDNSLYRTVTFDRPIDLTRSEAPGLNFKVDLRRVLVKPGGEFLDFRQHEILHNDAGGFYKFITDGLENAITLE